MPEKPRKDVDPVEALDRLRDTDLPAYSSKGKPVSGGDHAGPILTAVPARPVASIAESAAAGPPPITRFRCLACGYPLAGLAELRCTECGRKFDRAVVADWFDGDEETRFQNVAWLAAACLFLRLLLLPSLLWVARGGTAAVAFSACLVAYGGRRGTVGGYFAISGMLVAALMLGFSAPATMLAFYTLDIIAGCVCLLAMLSHAGGAVAAGAIQRGFTLAVLFATPILAMVCHILDRDVGATLTSTWPILASYPLFSYIGPAVAAAAVWLFAWATLARVRSVLYRPLDG